MAYDPSLQREGNVAFKITHPDNGWATNSKSYKFGPFGDRKTLDVSAFKKADRTLEIRCAFQHFFHTFLGPMPDAPDGLVSVLLTWSDKQITLHVNGKAVSSTPFGPSKH